MLLPLVLPGDFWATQTLLSKAGCYYFGLLGVAIAARRLTVTNGSIATPNAHLADIPILGRHNSKRGALVGCCFAPCSMLRKEKSHMLRKKQESLPCKRVWDRGRVAFPWFISDSVQSAESVE